MLPAKYMELIMTSPVCWGGLLFPINLAGIEGLLSIEVENLKHWVSFMAIESM